MKYSITQLGKELDPRKYYIDIDSKYFSTKENNLSINFFNENNYKFETGYNCTFKTGNDCIFTTGSNCTFNTGRNCTFKTGWYGSFQTKSKCKFITGSNCTFNTESFCTFTTLNNCTFKTGSGCKFNTADNCKFNTGGECIFVIWPKAFIKCQDESLITIKKMFRTTNVDTLTIPNKIVFIGYKNLKIINNIDLTDLTLTVWNNKDLILNCKNPDYKDVCKFYLENS